MSENHVIDIGRLDPKLLKLGVDRKVGAGAKVQQAGQRPPVGGLLDDAIIVARVERYVALRVLDQENATLTSA